MEDSVADIELAREGRIAQVDPYYAPPALSTPRMFAMSTAAKVGIALFVFVFAMTRDLKLSLLVAAVHIILHALLK
jgi:hypothetical protein